MFTATMRHILTRCICALEIDRPLDATHPNLKRALPCSLVVRMRILTSNESWKIAILIAYESDCDFFLISLIGNPIYRPLVRSWSLKLHYVEYAIGYALIVNAI